MEKKLEDIGEKDLLAICSDCRKIRVDDDEYVWISKEDNQELYNKYIKVYEGNLTHSYCPPCLRKAREEMRIKRPTKAPSQ